MKYQNPLTVYIIWHPNLKVGEEIGAKLFGAFCREVDHPLDQRLGIPTYFRSTPTDTGRPIDIDFTESDRTVIVCLIDNEMINDEPFKAYITSLYAQSKLVPECRFIPVSLSQWAHGFDDEIGKLNFIKADSQDLSNDQVFDIIYHNLLHELCKIFMAGTDLKKALPAVKLFISHSKHDEVLSEAQNFRDYIAKNLQLKTFFDINDIGRGEDFAATLEQNVGQSVVIVFLSDTFSSREWCRTEIIIAKKNHCPIVVINAITKGENRSFPYLGNVPTTKWSNDPAAVVNLALETTLASFFIKESLQKQAAFFQVENDFTLSSYPELFSIIGIKQALISQNKQAAIVLYPDPPLGNEELRLLNEMDDRLSFITPLQLTTFFSYE